MIDAAIAIKVGGNLAEKHKNRIGAFHPHSGVIIDFNLLKTLSEAHVRNGVAELIKISTVEHAEAFELLEQHTENLIKYKFGFAEGSPEGLREVGQTIAKMCVQKMLELECPNLLEHDQNRAIAYGHTWSPVYELTQSQCLSTTGMRSPLTCASVPRGQRRRDGSRSRCATASTPSSAAPGSHGTTIASRRRSSTTERRRSWSAATATSTLRFRTAKSASAASSWSKISPRARRWTQAWSLPWSCTGI